MAKVEATPTPVPVPGLKTGNPEPFGRFRTGSGAGTGEIINVSCLTGTGSRSVPELKNGNRVSLQKLRVSITWVRFDHVLGKGSRFGR